MYPIIESWGYISKKGTSKISPVLALPPMVSNPQLDGSYGVWTNVVLPIPMDFYPKNHPIPKFDHLGGTPKFIQTNPYLAHLFYLVVHLCESHESCS